MDSMKSSEELLREASALGNLEAVKALVDLGVDINSQNSMNGWTALHWASKRGHKQLVSFLLSRNANTCLTSVYGETALSLSSDNEIRGAFSGSDSDTPKLVEKPALPITPNYLSHPPLVYDIDMKPQKRKSIPEDIIHQITEKEIVLKVRVADSIDKDFIEIEVPLKEMTYEKVFQLCCGELGIESTNVLKLRKLPDTIVRKDKDVLRFQDFQELELVLKNSNGMPASLNLRNNQQPFMRIGNSFIRRDGSKSVASSRELYLVKRRNHKLPGMF